MIDIEVSLKEFLNLPIVENSVEVASSIEDLAKIYNDYVLSFAFKMSDSILILPLLDYIAKEKGIIFDWWLASENEGNEVFTVRIDFKNYVSAEIRVRFKYSFETIEGEDLYTYIAKYASEECGPKALSWITPFKSSFSDRVFCTGIIIS